MIIFIFLIGICVGSFLCVLVDRIPNNENPFVGRSHCDRCKKSLYPQDMIPLFSYAALNGSCRFCKHKLSLYYPFMELLTGVMFVITLLILQQNNMNGFLYSTKSFLEVFYYLLLICAFIVIFFADLKYGIIPFFAVVVGVLMTLLLHTTIPVVSTSLLNYFLSGIGAFLFFLILFFITNRIAKGNGMGFGDVVYVFLMGFLLGFPKIILGMYIAFISGAVISLILVVLKKRKMRGGTIPFGPFLVLGTVISLFWGDIFVQQILAYLLR